MIYRACIPGVARPLRLPRRDSSRRLFSKADHKVKAL